MKKLIGVTIAILFMLTFSIVSYAQEQEGRIFIPLEDIKVYKEIGPGAEEFIIPKDEKIELEANIEFGFFKMIHWNDNVWFIKEGELEKCYEFINVYSGVFANMTEEEEDLLLKVLYLEGCAQDFQGQCMNLEVILNRCVKENAWGNTIYEVLSGKHQFETWKAASSGKLIEGEPYKKYKDPCVDFTTQREVIAYVKENGRTFLEEEYVFFASFSGANGKKSSEIYHDGHYYAK